jgi:serine carboxypeptidase-like clade 2
LQQEYDISDYLNREDVRKALNIPSSIQAWVECNHENIDYKKLEEGSFWLYPILKSANLRILIFSGDTDGAVPHIGTQEWIKLLKLPVV